MVSFWDISDGIGHNRKYFGVDSFTFSRFSFFPSWLVTFYWGYFWLFLYQIWSWVDNFNQFWSELAMFLVNFGKLWGNWPCFDCFIFFDIHCFWPRLIVPGQIWSCSGEFSHFVSFDSWIWLGLIVHGPIWWSLDQFCSFWSDLAEFCQFWSFLIKLGFSCYWWNLILLSRFWHILVRFGHFG